MFRQTKSPINSNRLQMIVVILVLVFTTLACSQEYLSPLSLTATAYTPVGTFVTDTPETIVIATPIPDDLPTESNIQPDEPTITPILLSQEPAPILSGTPEPTLFYTTQNGDSLKPLAKRFDVSTDEILQYNDVNKSGYLPVNVQLTIIDRQIQAGPTDRLLPDSEVVYSPTTLDFDIQFYVQEAGGYLSRYSEYVGTTNRSGWEIVQIIAQDNSVNPRLLLSILEYQSHWIYGSPLNQAQIDYPVGYRNANFKGLYKQLGWAARRLEMGFYGWRDGSLLFVPFGASKQLRIAPQVNAGSAALQYLFAHLYQVEDWFSTLYGENDFITLHESMFGNSWNRASEYEPYLSDTLVQAEMELPFPVGHTWNYTGGPHEVWGDGSPYAALDFAPIGVKNCDTTNEWITTSAPGLVLRSEDAAVVIDLDGDGYEQTGWVIFYLHVATRGRVPAGTYLDINAHIGHPSCEGGNATGTHVHIARKYNGEWMLAGGPVPFTMSGWIAQNGTAEYEGTLIKHEQVVKANVVSSFETRITR